MDQQAIKNRFGIIGNSPALNHALNVAVQVAVAEGVAHHCRLKSGRSLLARPLHREQQQQRQLAPR